MRLRAKQLCGVGTDYTGYYSDGPTTIWQQEPLISNINAWKPRVGNVCAMAFVPNNLFDVPPNPQCSVYDEGKWETLLQAFSARGCYVTANYHNNYPDSAQYFGSQQMTDFWLAFANRWKGDPRMVGYILFNEMAHSGYDTWAPSITSIQDVANYASWLTREIHKIDSNAVIIYPCTSLVALPPNAISAIEATGIFSEDNVVFDTHHPYFFESYPDLDMGQTPEENATLINGYYFQPWIGAVGKDRVYSHGMFPFVGASYHDDLQTRWITAIMNVYQSAGIGMNSWNMLQYGSTSQNYIDQMTGVQNSNFVPEPFLENTNTIPLPYHDDFSDLSRLQVINGNWSVE